jgi:dipeptidyl aminopeptidase/acylaminoacyl peptidase
LRIYHHTVDDNVHYGAVILPEDYEGDSRPVLLVASGLNVQDLTLYVETWLARTDPVTMAFPDMIVVLPSYRGRVLSYDRFDFQSTGSACDAFDGSTDDALAFLNVVVDQIPEADSTRMAIMGFSRGGTIAHLAGQRDDRLGLVIAAAGLTDFYRQDATLYRWYECNFVTGRTSHDSRLKILASSPLHFTRRSPATRIHHGTDDVGVPLWNAQEMHARLIASGVNSRLYIYNAGHGLASFPQFQEDARTNLAEFLGVVASRQIN